MLFIQNLLRNERGNISCEPYMQTRSRQNLPAERKWPEVNQRVLYPVKETLVRMENGSLINMYDPVVQFCVYFITLNVADVGLKRVIGSWNSHSINGKDNRIPDVVARATRRIRPLTPTIVPSVQDAMQMYTNAGGVLTSECSFGNDPLAHDGALRNRRDAEFVRNNPSFSQIFENVIIGNGALMETAILSFINITRYLSP
ncbi:uncharacterized protein [Acropora muricata]|uniref:uncharacterized protein n=1 Tax=Acropora muricata TaxID=159855 RepID=UPI0034E4DE8D